MRILNTGNVGIGTATPVSLFSVGASSQFQVNTTGVVVAGTWQGGAVGAVYGGTALNTSGSSGLPSINAGTWAVNNVLTAGRVLYGAASNTVASSANLYFDGTKLGIGTASPVANSALTLDNGANAYGLIIQNTGDDAGWQLRPGGTAQVYATGTTAGVFSLEANTEIRFRTSSAQQVAIASTGVVSFKNYSFPLADGTNDQVMTTNGSGSLTWSDKAGGGGGGITSLEGQTGAAQVFTDDTNVTIVSASNAHVITWAGTLAAARLNANVAQAITNDTNVTGSIAAQNLTLGWTGQLAVARGGTGLATLAAGRIPYGAGTSAFANSANLTFDGNALTITPTTGAYRALNLTQNGLGGAPGAAFVYNNCTLVDDNLDAGAVAAKVNQLALTHTYGGVAMRGGRNTLEVTSAFGAASHASNPDRNYVAGVFSIWANDDDGGGAGTEKGAFFALAGNAIAATGAVNLVELAWCEINMQASTGSSMLHKVGVSIANYPDDVVQGSTTDAAISISRQAGGGALSTTIGWDHGVLFSNMNGQYPMATDGTLFGVTGASTVAYGIDFNGWTITGAAWRSTSGNVAFAAANQGVELGAPGSANTPYLDFHSSGNDIDYDSRIIASGGSAVVGAGRLIFTAGSIQYGVPLVGLGGGAAATLGTIGGSGPTVAAQNTWMEWIDSTGATCWVPVWK